MKAYLVCIGAATLMAAAAVPQLSIEIADSIVEELAANDVAAVTRLLHYPAFYTEKERTDDESAVAVGISLLLDEFGQITQYERHEQPVIFYELTLSGGTVDYWESLSSMRTNETIYRASFEKVEDGIVKVVTFSSEEAAGIQSIAFGIKADADNARERITEIGAKLRTAIMGQGDDGDGSAS